jgi:hypothetical protein
LSLLCATLFSWCTYADEPAERAAIERAVSTLPSVERAQVVISHEPWGEATLEILRLHRAVRAIRFVTSEVALVETTRGSTPVLIVMKKEGADWHFVSQHVLAQP